MKDGNIVVAVYGLGHVGLGITAVCLRAGAKVIGVDLKDDVVKSINKGVPPIKDEPGIPDAVGKSVAEGRFRATTDGVEASKDSEVKIITVPTILTSTRKCDLSALKQALRVIGEGMKVGDLVIIESSVPPTTTVKMAKTILEKTSKLSAEQDFGLTYNPERIYEGRVLEDIEERYPKAVGGMGPRSTEAVAALYELIAKKSVIRTTNPTIAETSKLFDGVYRDANIVLVNELGRFCGGLGIDFKEVRDVANSQPFSHFHLPGFVGGLCIPFYPYFLLQVAGDRKMNLALTKLARKINEGKPQLLVKVAHSTLTKLSGKSLQGSVVAVLGLAFRGDTWDNRNSPSYQVIDLLLKKGVSTIRAYDPYVTRDAILDKKGVQLVSTINDATQSSNLILIMTEHSTFGKDLTPSSLLKNVSTPAALMDGRNILSLDRVGGTMTKRTAHERLEGFQIFVKLAS